MGRDSKIAWTDHKPNINPLTGKPGPAPKAPIDGDKKQARRRINLEVRTGRRAHPNTIPCTDCGHIWQPGERRHEYDHHLGYVAKYHRHVESVCTKCHSKRDNSKSQQTHCIKGHEFTIENTYFKSNGCRSCKECSRERDRNRKRPDGYWKKVNDKRRGIENG